MKRSFLILLGGLALIACDKDSSLIIDETSDTQISVRSADKVDVCHFSEEDQTYEVKSINRKALAAHEKHGDVVDNDGDGYFASENGCGLPVDCDDNDAAVQTCECPSFTIEDLNQIGWTPPFYYDPLYDCCGGGVEILGSAGQFTFAFVRFDANIVQIADFEDGVPNISQIGLSDHEARACEKLIEDYAKQVLNLPEEGCNRCN